MQVNNTYHGSEVHHVTECVHDHGHNSLKHGGAAGQSAGFTEPIETAQSIQENVNLIGLGMDGSKKSIWSKGIGFLKGIWESAGEQEGSQLPLADNHGIQAQTRLPVTNEAAVPVREALPKRILQRIQTITARIKVGIGGAYGNLAKEEGKLSSGRKHGYKTPEVKETTENNQESLEAAGRLEETNIPIMEQRNSYLLDSYTKKGEYCQLKDHLKQ